MSQEPELLPSGALLVSKLWNPPLVPLHLATGEKEGGWLAVRPVGGLVHFYPYSLGWYSATRSKPNYGAGMCGRTSRRKRERAGLTLSIVLDTPEHSDDISCILLG